MREFKPMDHNAIHRSVSVMGFDLQRMIEKKRTNVARYAMAETEQQFQQDFTATLNGSGVPLFIPATFTFPETVVYAPRQRQVSNEDPQVWVGAVLDVGHAHVTGFVKKWVMDASANYIGADVIISLLGSGEVKGTVHFTFQGLSSPNDDLGLDDGPS
jgi:hypothetical protein